MIPFILAAVGGYLIGSSVKNTDVFSNGGNLDKYNSMTKYKLEKELNKLTDEFYEIRKSYNTTEHPRQKEIEIEKDKIITLLYGENFSGVGQKYKYEEGGKMASGGVTYPNLSAQQPSVVNDSDSAEKTKRIKEVDIVKVGSVKLVEGSDKQITSSRDAYLIFKDFWQENQLNIAEHFNVLLLNKANKPIGLYQHSKGGIDGTIADIEMISALAVKSLAKGVIVAHNHPSDNLKPSEADVKLTKELKQALALFKISLLDSLIITPSNSYTSFADEGLI